MPIDVKASITQKAEETSLNILETKTNVAKGALSCFNLLRCIETPVRPWV